MPPGNLPPKAQEIYLAAEKSAKKTCPEGDEACIASKAWAAVKRGFKKEGDKWVSKSTVEFSLFINRASYNKATGEMRWFAVASDTDPDSYNDEMSLELYADFIKRIESEELPPERHRSKFWSGGKPYLSISHYLDLDGLAVPGVTDEIYTDGKCLKANGRFRNTVLGKACFDAICQDLYGEEKSNHDNKIRISIAFVDWGHVHKSNGYKFIRESLDHLCPECLVEHVSGTGEGKIFMLGHLIHLALTRVPVNARTSMEVRSMTTQLEDAESIVGEELAEEISKAADEMKADLVIKSEQDEEPVVEEVKAESCDKKKKDDEEDDEEKEEMKAKIVEDVKPVAHALFDPVNVFLSQYDQVAESELTYHEKLQAIQSAYEQLGEAVKSSFAPTQAETASHDMEELKSMVATLIQQNENLATEVALLKQKGLASNPADVIPTERRRSINPADIQRMVSQPAQNQPVKIGDFVNRSVRGY